MSCSSLFKSSIFLTAADVGSYTYGLTHAMKPQRMRITHELVSAYDMLPKMHVLVRVYSRSLSVQQTDAKTAARETRHG